MITTAGELIKRYEADVTRAYAKGVADERARCAWICEEYAQSYERQREASESIKRRIIESESKTEQQEQLDELDKRNLGTL